MQMTAARRQHLEGQALACQRNAAKAYAYSRVWHSKLAKVDRIYWQLSRAFWASEAMRFLDLLINSEDD